MYNTLIPNPPPLIPLPRPAVLQGGRGLKGIKGGDTRGEEFIPVVVYVYILG